MLVNDMNKQIAKFRSNELGENLSRAAGELVTLLTQSQIRSPEAQKSLATLVDVAAVLCHCTQQQLTIDQPPPLDAAALVPLQPSDLAQALTAQTSSSKQAPDVRPAPERQRNISELLKVMRALRDPQSGCPWDKEQTFATIAPYTIEEAYEVVDAIERNDLQALKEELGDLLLQVVYHAQIADEQQAFTFGDVVEAITSKMIRRHPHVFGTPEQRRNVVAEDFWEQQKDLERQQNTSSSAGSVGAGDIMADRESLTAGSVLDDVPLPLPALTRAIKLQNKAARVGFDWPSLKPVFDKMREELAELEQIIDGEDIAHIEEEYGDLLFVVANVARHLKIDPEQALRRTNGKFIRRFQRIEALLAERGKTPAQSDLKEMDELWDQAKREEYGDADRK